MSCAAGVPVSEVAERLGVSVADVLSARPEGPLWLGLAEVVVEVLEGCQEGLRRASGHPTPL